MILCTLLLGICRINRNVIYPFISIAQLMWSSYLYTVSGVRAVTKISPYVEIAAGSAVLFKN